MKEQDIKRNASGYYDEPCYKAVTAPPRPGEIWLHKNSGAYMLVMSSWNGVCSTLRLTDHGDEGTVPVMCKTQMYAKPIMIGYCFENLLTQFVKAIKQEEFIVVQRAVVKALGIGTEAALGIGTSTDVHQDVVNAMEARIRMLEEEVMTLENKNKRLAKNIDQATEDLISHTDTIEERDQEITRLNIYKDMYMELLDKLVSVRGGAINE